MMTQNDDMRDERRRLIAVNYPTGREKKNYNKENSDSNRSNKNKQNKASKTKQNERKP